MEKEELIVARNCQPSGSPSGYLGAEVAIGRISLEKLSELKLTYHLRTKMKI